jgi:hypothetical protein
VLTTTMMHEHPAEVNSPRPEKSHDADQPL